jgi:hypothetical protein
VANSMRHEVGGGFAMRSIEVATLADAYDEH